MKPLGVFDVGSDIKSSGRTWPMANLEPVQTSQDYSFGLCGVGSHSNGIYWRGWLWGHTCWGRCSQAESNVWEKWQFKWHTSEVECLSVATNRQQLGLIKNPLHTFRVFWIWWCWGIFFFFLFFAYLGFYRILLNLLVFFETRNMWPNTHASKCVRLVSI